MRIPVSRSLVELAEQLRVQGEGMPSGNLYLVTDVSGQVLSAHLLDSKAKKEVEKLEEDGELAIVTPLPLKLCADILDVLTTIRELPMKGWALGSDEDNHLVPSWVHN